MPVSLSPMSKSLRQQSELRKLPVLPSSMQSSKEQSLSLFCSKLVERCVPVFFCSCWKGRGAILFHFLICFDLLSFEGQWQRNIFEYLLFFSIPPLPSKLDHIIAFWICEPYNGNVKNKSIDHDTYTWWKWVMIYRVWFILWGHFKPLSGLQECLLITWAWINKYVKTSVFRLRFITNVLSYIIEYFICEPYNENVKNNRIDHDTLISHDLIFIMN